MPSDLGWWLIAAVLLLAFSKFAEQFPPAAEGDGPCDDPDSGHYVL